MKLYKLTNEDGKTRDHTQWGPGIEHTANGEGGLCGHGWLHAYTSPLVALLLNPIHAAFEKPRLWEAEGDVGKIDGQLKVGCTRLRTIRELQVPEITTQQRVKFAIFCALEVCDDSKFVDWAVSWLSGNDRTLPAAEAAAEEAAEAAKAAAAEWAAEAAAEWAAAEEAAAEAAEWAAKAAAKEAEAAAKAAAKEAEAAEWAAAMGAAAALAWGKPRYIPFNLHDIARKAIKE